METAAQGKKVVEGHRPTPILQMGIRLQPPLLCLLSEALVVPALVSTEPEAPATPPPTTAEAPKDVADEKEVIPSPATPLPPAKEKADDSKAFAVIEIQKSLEGNSRIKKGLPWILWIFVF
ncbi:uncharacterized protein A4U43_C08F24890 [Asparagus officinalis]|nr:uncharacterized protein A4U43_C08F24890 [Asparagus officinalis]